MVGVHDQTGTLKRGQIAIHVPRLGLTALDDLLCYQLELLSASTRNARTLFLHPFFNHTHSATLLRDARGGVHVSGTGEPAGY